MADTVATIVIEDYALSAYRTVHLTCISDGTGESNVVKIDKSTISTAPDGAEPAALDILWVRWNIQGISYVKLSWDHTTDAVAMVLSGNGYEEFRNQRGDVPLLDPRTAGDTGDLLLTSVGAVSGGSYDITICVRKAND
jgi:hypothetical protein